MLESLVKILTKRTSQEFYKPVDVHSVMNAIGKTISSISIWNIVNQLDKYNFSCRPVVNKLEDQINRNRFDLILARLYWNCPTIENLRCLNFDANEII